MKQSSMTLSIIPLYVTTLTILKYGYKKLPSNPTVFTNLVGNMILTPITFLKVIFFNEVLSELPVELHGDVQINIRNILYYLGKGAYIRTISMEIDRDVSAENLEIIFTAIGAYTELTLVPLNSRIYISNSTVLLLPQSDA